MLPTYRNDSSSAYIVSSLFDLGSQLLLCRSLLAYLSHTATLHGSIRLVSTCGISDKDDWWFPRFPWESVPSNSHYNIINVTGGYGKGLYVDQFPVTCSQYAAYLR